MVRTCPNKLEPKEMVKLIHKIAISILMLSNYESIEVDRRKSVISRLTKRWELYYGHCQNLLRCDKVLVFAPSDCILELLHASNLSSLPDGRSTACPMQMSLYKLFIYYRHIYYLCCLYIDFLLALRLVWLFVFCLY